MNSSAAFAITLQHQVAILAKVKENTQMHNPSLTLKKFAVQAIYIQY